MRVKRTTEQSSTSARDGGFPSRTAEVGVVLMDLAYQPIAVDNGAASILAALLDDGDWREPGPQAEWGLPSEILEQMRRTNPADLSSMKMRFYVAGHLYAVRAYYMEPQVGMVEKGYVVLHLEREADIGDSVFQVGLEYRLTDREREALAGLAVGLTSKELAERMNIRPNTVKAFLRVIMIKMGAPNRAGIVAKLLHTSRPSEEVWNQASMSAASTNGN